MSEPTTLEFSPELRIMLDAGRGDESAAVVTEIACQCAPGECPCGDGSSPCQWGGGCGMCTDQECDCEVCFENRREFRSAFDTSSMPLTASSECFDFRGDTILWACTAPFEHPAEEGKVLYGVQMNEPHNDSDSARIFWAYSPSSSVAADAYEHIVRDSRIVRFRGWDATDVTGALLAPLGALTLADALSGL